MTRVTLPSRRLNTTVKCRHEWASGNASKLLITFGFDEEGRVRELFCADFKEGTDMHTLVMDACVVLSLLLQHGYKASELRNKLAQAPQSLLATLVGEVAKMEEKDDVR